MTPSKSTTAGWLPVEIGLDLQPAVVQEALVRWMEFGSTPLTEPFLNHTIEKLRAATPAAREIETDLDTMVRLSSRLPEVRPAGFIFHISHCGSTLIANAMKTAGRAVVVSESRPVSALLRHVPEKRDGAFLTRRWNGIRRTLLDSLFRLFAHYRTGASEPLVLKFVSLDTLAIGVIRSYWPDVPCVMVIRDPVEVMVTNLKVGGWLSFKGHPEAASSVFGWDDLPRTTAEMTNEEFCARALGSFCASAAEAVDERVMVVDYVDLSPAKMCEIGEFFSLEVSSAGIEQVFGPYAKDPQKKIRFEDDRERKQKMAGMMIRSAANQWAVGPYTDLKNLRRRRSQSWCKL